MLTAGRQRNKRRLTLQSDAAIFSSAKITGISIKLFFQLSRRDPSKRLVGIHYNRGK